jgi:MOSC domain-containing protein YiiM
MSAENAVAKGIGTIVAVSVSATKGVQKSNVERAVLRAEWGLEGDAHAGEWHRQVSLLAEESIEKMRRMGLDVTAGDFAENLTTSGIDVPGLHIGDRVKVGREVELEVTQIGKECHTRCAIYQQAGDCVMPKEGVFAKVLSGGEVRPGDPVLVIRAGGAAPSAGPSEV